MYQKNREAGVLLHITSLPSQYGCGSMGKEAYDFVDFLEKSGFTYWEVLPINIPDLDSFSPYSSSSSFFGNPLMIDLDWLVKKGYTTHDFLVENFEQVKIEGNHYNFKDLYSKKMELLKKIYNELEDDDVIDEICKFLEKNEEIDKACVYYALKEKNNNLNWQEWNDFEFDKETKMFYGFLSYLFEKQWFELKQYANYHRVKLFGDVPIYVHLESADVYYNQSCFDLKDGYPLYVSGCPDGGPDKKGQKWNHPLYDTVNAKSDVNNFLSKRFNFLLDHFDLLRIDHFKAFVKYYKIPFDKEPLDKDSCYDENGIGIEVLKNLNGCDRLIAEDLGGEKECASVLKDLDIPGMKIMQSSYCIDNYPIESIAYTGNHDNNTMLGYYDEKYKKDYNNFAKVQNDIRRLIHSNSKIVLLPVQDILVQDESCKMNEPGTVDKSNWSYALTYENMEVLHSKERELHLLIEEAHNKLHLTSLQKLDIHKYFGDIVVTYYETDRDKCIEYFEELDKNGLKYIENPIDEKKLTGSEYEDRIDNILKKASCYVLIASSKLMKKFSALRRLIWYQIGIVSAAREDAFLIYTIDNIDFSKSPLSQIHYDNMKKGVKEMVDTIMKDHSMQILKQKFYDNSIIENYTREKIEYNTIQIELTIDREISEKAISYVKRQTNYPGEFTFKDLFNKTECNVKVLKFSFEDDKLMDYNYQDEINVSKESIFLSDEFHNEKHIRVIKEPITESIKGYKCSFQFIAPVHNPLGVTLKPYFEFRDEDKEFCFLCFKRILEKSLSQLELKMKDFYFRNNRIYFSFNFLSDNCIKKIKDDEYKVGKIADFIYPS